MLKMNGVGHQKLGDIKPKKDVNKKTIIIYRRWRLGDIIMCEPVNRYWFNQGYNIYFCSSSQYHPIIKSFSDNPPKTITYHADKEGKLINPGYNYDMEYNLDVVGLDHSDHVSKVDSFLSVAGIDYKNIDHQYRTPTLEVSSMHLSWAKIMLQEHKLLNLPLIAVVRQSYSEKSPRSVPFKILDELYRLLSQNFRVLVIGEKPVKININDNIYNFTGCTPDVMSLAGLLSQCKLLITGDTGLMHLAGSIGLPLISILGPTRPEDISLFYKNNTIIDAGKDCSPCFDRGCDNRCLDDLDPKFIYNQTIDRINAPFMETTVIKSR